MADVLPASTEHRAPQVAGSMCESPPTAQSSMAGVALPQDPATSTLELAV
jgi:hypothetical protein